MVTVVKYGAAAACGAVLTAAGLWAWMVWYTSHRR